MNAVKQANFGEIIRKIRIEKKLPLRSVASQLDIDQAILSKIERGKRQANRPQVFKLAGFFGLDEEELLVAWLSDKLLYELTGEHVALKALQVAEEKMEYLVYEKLDRQATYELIKNHLKLFEKINKAWLFGSFARGDDSPESDIDLAIQTDPGFSYFDLAEVQHVLETAVNKKVDVGFFDAIKPQVLERIKPDMILLYER